MSKRIKNTFQKFSFIFSIFSVIASIASAITLYLKVDTLGWDHPISASLLASIFFFGLVAFLLSIISNSDIPSFKI